MKRLLIVTGALGHLGNTILRQLQNKKDWEVRALCLEGERERALPMPNVAYYAGDIRKKETLRPLFENLEDYDPVYVIHAAGIVDISDHVSERLFETNVIGTKNMIDLCKEYPVTRLLYVSSVHAISEGNPSKVLSEAESFSPNLVKGGYAKTKAQATQLVMEAAREGLDAVVVHPSGILGPYDYSGNHLVQLVRDYIGGSLPACVQGGYDFVDVRDVADGCLRALQRGEAGECYILSNRWYSIRDILKMIRKAEGGRLLPVLPLWMARAVLPVINVGAKVMKKRPLYTKYSLYTLGSNSKFSHDKATARLGYAPRDLYDTLRDTVAWINAEKCLHEKRFTLKRKVRLGRPRFA